MQKETRDMFLYTIYPRYRQTHVISDDVLVCKHIGDEKVYIEWTTPSFFVALEEFEEV